VWKWTLEPEKASTGLDWMGRNIVKRKASTRWQDKKNMDLGIGIGIGEKQTEQVDERWKTPQPIVCIIDGQMSFPFLVLPYVCSRYTFLFCSVNKSSYSCKFSSLTKFQEISTSSTSKPQ
jgi:hypothetical protein